MARPDGRVEAGQRASRAFSARAWNRAQDAADIVLGSRPGLAAQAGPAYGGRVIIKGYVTEVPQDFEVRLGHWVEIRGIRNMDNRVANCRLVVPTTTQAYQHDVPTPLGVVVGGVELPAYNKPTVVDVCIAGPTNAYVCREIDSLQKCGFPRLRYTGETTTNLRGTVELNECGRHTCLGGNLSTIVQGPTGATGPSVILTQVLVNG